MSYAGNFKKKEEEITESVELDLKQMTLQEIVEI